MQVELTETLTRGLALAEASVDTDTGVISGVALLGRISRNDRVYSEAAMRQAAELYRDVGVFVDHPTSSEIRDRDGVRSVRDLAGRVLRATVSGNFVRGDIQVLRGHAPGDLVLALAERMPGVVGFSHRATGTTSRDSSGTEVVDAVTAVASVDLVADPATVNGLFESLIESKGAKKMNKEMTPTEINEWSQKLAMGDPWGPPDPSKKPVTAATIQEARQKLFI